MFNDLSRLGKYLGQAARLMVGMPESSASCTVRSWRWCSRT